MAARYGISTNPLIALSLNADIISETTIPSKTAIHINEKISLLYDNKVIGHTKANIAWIVHKHTYKNLSRISVFVLHSFWSARYRLSPASKARTPQPSITVFSFGVQCGTIIA